MIGTDKGVLVLTILEENRENTEKEIAGMPQLLVISRVPGHLNWRQ